MGGSLRNAASRISRGAWLFSLGYGIHLAWIALMFYQGTFFDLAGNGDFYFAYYLASMTALIASLVLLGTVKGENRHTGFFARRPTMLAFSGAAALGTLLVLFSGLGGPEGMALFVASAVLTGVGSSYIHIMWGQLLVAHREAQAITALCLAYSISAVIYCIVSYLPAVLAVALSVLMPLASMGVALLPGMERAESARLSAADGPADECAVRDARSFAVRVVLAAVVFGLVNGGINGFMKGSGEPALFPQAHSALFLLCFNLVFVVVVPYMESRRLQSPPSERFVAVYRVSLLAVVGALLVSSVQGASSLVLGVVMLVGYTAFKILVWSELCLICRAGSIAPARLFGFGEAGMAAALLLSNFVMNRLGGAGFDADGMRALIALGIAGLLGTYLFLLTERAVLAINDIGKPKEAEGARMRFQDKMDALANAHGLTKREAEVLKLFVRGRSGARIAEDLYISSGTVSTHLRNVYRKLGVHSRQELIDLLDAAGPVLAETARVEPAGAEQE